jgi:hypothetical protein
MKYQSGAIRGHFMLEKELENRYKEFLQIVTYISRAA